MSQPIDSNWWWPLLLSALAILLVQNLWRAHGQGVIKMQQWEVKRSERPGAFWSTVLTEGIFLITCLVLLTQWLAQRI